MKITISTNKTKIAFIHSDATKHHSSGEREEYEVTDPLQEQLIKKASLKDIIWDNETKTATLMTESQIADEKTLQTLTAEMSALDQEMLNMRAARILEDNIARRIAEGEDVPEELRDIVQRREQKRVELVAVLPSPAPAPATPEAPTPEAPEAPEAPKPPPTPKQEKKAK